MGFFWNRDRYCDRLRNSNCTSFCKKGKSNLKEPSVVAINRNNNKILAIGDEARKMIGSGTPGNIVAVRPLKDGVISDYDMTQKMLKEL